MIIKLLKAIGPQRKAADPIKRARALEEYGKSKGKKASYRWKDK